MNDEPPYLREGVHTFIFCRELMESPEDIPPLEVQKGAAIEALTQPVYDTETDSFTFHIRIINP